MELIDYLHLLAMALLIVGLVLACAIITRYQNRHTKTDRRGSKYYVPKFTAKFDPFLRRWTPEWRAYVKRDHEWWDERFNDLV